MSPTEEGNPGSLGCILPDGTQGTNYSFFGAGPGVANPDNVIAEIDAAWQKLGVKGTITSIGDSNEKIGDTRILADPPHLSGTYPDGYAVQIWIGTKYSSFNANSHCVPLPRDFVMQSHTSDSSDMSDHPDVSHDVRDYDW